MANSSSTGLGSEHDLEHRERVGSFAIRSEMTHWVLATVFEEEC